MKAPLAKEIRRKANSEELVPQLEAAETIEAETPMQEAPPAAVSAPPVAEAFDGPTF